MSETAPGNATAGATVFMFPSYPSKSALRKSRLAPTSRWNEAFEEFGVGNVSYLRRIENIFFLILLFVMMNPLGYYSNPTQNDGQITS